MDALEVINSRDRNGDAIPFSIAFYTWNDRTGQGGELVKLDKVRLVVKKAYSRKKAGEAINRKREPNNYANFTRTLEVLDPKWVQSHGHSMLSVHVVLIEEINNKPVHWYING